MKQVQRLFQPRSVVVVGASKSSGKIGHDVFLNIKKSFKGKLYGVNTTGGSLKGITLYKSVSELPRVPDLAIIIVPAQAVTMVVREAAAFGIKNYVVISAGFKESGEAGRRREAELLKLRDQFGITILGPNCLGFINSALRLNASFASSDLSDGTVSLVSQSGAMAVALMDLAAEHSMGLRTMVSLGNKADVNEIDVLEYLEQDSKTKVISLYLEEIADPQRFAVVASRVGRKKRVVILKAGTSSEGKKAAASHTGSIAQQEPLIDAMLSQAGVIRARNIREFFLLSHTLGLESRRIGRSIAIVTNAGGPAIIASDNVAKYGLKLAKITTTTQKKIRTILPEASAVSNPIDVLGDGDEQRFKQVVRVLEQTGDIDAVVVIVTPQTMTPVDKIATWLAQTSFKKIVVPVFVGGASMQDSERLFDKKKKPYFTFPEHALLYLGSLSKRPPSLYTLQAVNLYRQKSIMRPDIAEKYLQKHAIGGITKSIYQAKNQRVPQVVPATAVVKVWAPGSIIHKAKAGGVMTQVSGRDEIRKAEREIINKIGARKIEGFLIQPQQKVGIEMYVGAIRDAQFGPVTIVGAGGVLLETLHDVTLRLGKVSLSEARAMLQELRIYSGITHLDLTAFSKLITHVSQLVSEDSDVAELDLNPVLLYKKGLSAVDIRLYMYKK